MFKQDEFKETIKELDEMFEEVLNIFNFPPNIKTIGNIFKTDNAYGIEIPMPGVSKEEIDIELVDNDLKVSVKEIENTKEYIRNVWKRTSMDLNYDLSYFNNVDLDDITSTFENGVLTILIGKKEKSEKKSKKVDIK